MRRLIPVALFLASTACVPTPSYYFIPPQHKPVGSEEIVGFGDYVLSAHPSAEAHYIKDVKGLEGSAWRWTLAEPEFRFYLKSAKNRVFRIDMALAEVTFKDTGPVQMNVVINGEVLDRPAFKTPGEHHYEKPVPERLLKEKAENRVLIQVVNPWQAPDPGVRLGFLLHGVGFGAK